MQRQFSIGLVVAVLMSGSVFGMNSSSRFAPIFSAFDLALQGARSIATHPMTVAVTSAVITAEWTIMRNGQKENVDLNKQKVLTAADACNIETALSQKLEIDKKKNAQAITTQEDIVKALAVQLPKNPELQKAHKDEADRLSTLKDRKRVLEKEDDTLFAVRRENTKTFGQTLSAANLSSGAKPTPAQ